MKKLLVIAVALASVNAFATRARTNSLGSSVHLIDTNTIYVNPSDMFSVGGDFVNLESGTSNVAVASATAGPDAEGMVVRSMGDSKLALAIGHDSLLGLQIRALAYTTISGLKGSSAAPTNYFQQNPVEVSYGMKNGDLAWAGTLIYSNFQSNTGINEKENTVGARFGVRSGNMDASLGLGLVNVYQNDYAKFTGTLGVTAAAGMWIDTLYVKAKAEAAAYKVENAANVDQSKVTGNTVTLSVVDSRKKDGNEFFYGASISSYEQKDSLGNEDSTSTLTMPVVIGLEQKAASWLTLRGSVTQAVLLNSSKKTTKTGTSESLAPGANNTKVAVGAGLNFDKITVDGSLAGLTTDSTGAGTQELNANKFLAQVGLTYMF